MPGTSLIYLALSFLAFIVALTVHEFSHAWAAEKLGDPNPKLQGRLSLNPLAHLDPIGTVALPLLLVLTGSPVVIGWAKPVRIDPFNLRNRRRDMGLISLAGPGANFALAIIASLILRSGLLPIGYSAGALFLLFLVITNLGLGCFNLLPINPLDGGKVLVGFLPHRLGYKVEGFLNQYGQFILIGLIFPFFGRSLLSVILTPVVDFFLNLLLPQNPLFF